MGTNFYWLPTDGVLPTGDSDPHDDLSPTIHLGKRAAAGWYCWDCRAPLYAGPTSAIHSGRYDDLDRCPTCSKTKGEGANRREAYNAAMVELGFATTPQPPERLTGVQGASSFSWAQDPERAKAICTEHLHEAIIQDEYERTYTGSEFLWMLESACPIEFTNSIGRAFC